MKVIQSYYLIIILLDCFNLIFFIHRANINNTFFRYNIMPRFDLIEWFPAFPSKCRPNSPTMYSNKEDYVGCQKIRTRIKASITAIIFIIIAIVVLIATKNIIISVILGIVGIVIGLLGFALGGLKASRDYDDMTMSFDNARRLDPNLTWGQFMNARTNLESGYSNNYNSGFGTGFGTGMGLSVGKSLIGMFRK